MPLTRIFTVAVSALIWSLALAAQAGLISNGDFESVTSLGPPADFAAWTELGNKADASVAPSVISGTYSAELNKGGTNSYLYQAPSGSPSDFLFDMDFAVFPAVGTSTSTRTMNVLLYYRATSDMINMRVDADNQLSAVSAGEWKKIGSLTALTTADTGTTGVWDGESPVVNHLSIAGFFSGSSPYYDVTLNGQTVSGVTFFQGAAPSGADNFVRTVRLQSYLSESNWLADNVTFAAVPEPSSLVLWLGLAGVGLLGWRKGRRAN